MTIQVIDRAVRLMRVVAKLGPISLTQLSEQTGLALPTTARIANSLTENGILQRLDDRKYQLGARLVPLATSLEPFRRSLQIAHSYIEELSATTREDCGLAVLQGNEAVVVDWCYGPRPPRIIEPYSREIPLHCAFGIVLIAFQKARWRNRYLQKANLKKMAAGTVPDLASLLDKIEQTRRTGLYVSSAENVEGAGSLAVPVFDHLSRLLGVLFVTAPLDRLSERQMERHKIALFDAANRLTAQFRKGSGQYPSN
jgi:DNA-binding IclR family transcriptional regulator